jgi:hypothetical protein
MNILEQQKTLAAMAAEIELHRTEADRLRKGVSDGLDAIMDQRAGDARKILRAALQRQAKPQTPTDQQEGVA